MKAKVFNKGQIVIPAALRKVFGIEIGGKVELIVMKDGIKIVPVKKREVSAKSLAGVFKKYAKNKKFPTEKEIEKITEKEFSERLKDEIY